MRLRSHYFSWKQVKEYGNGIGSICFVAFDWSVAVAIAVGAQLAAIRSSEGVCGMYAIDKNHQYRYIIPI